MKAALVAAVAALSIALPAARAAEPVGAPGTPPAQPAADEQALDAAIEQQWLGRPGLAESALRQMAERGHVIAMERLALLHWYGHLLYPGKPWDRGQAVAWFERAAAAGSELGRHMAREAQRLALRQETP